MCIIGHEHSLGASALGSSIWADWQIGQISRQIRAEPHESYPSPARGEGRHSSVVCGFNLAMRPHETERCNEHHPAEAATTHERCLTDDPRQLPRTTVFFSFFSFFLVLYAILPRCTA